MNKIKTLFSIRKVLFGLLACFMMSCDSDIVLTSGGVQGLPHDPRKPIEVTKFEPTTGAAGQQMVIYGKNFGNDPALVRVSFGGAEAVVVSANGDAIYCLVPERSETDDFIGFEDNSDDDEDVTEDETPVSQTEDDDEIEDEEKDPSARTIHVGVGAYEDMQVASFEENYFLYKKEWKVRTLAGKVNEKKEDDARTDTRPLPFEDCGNFPLPQNFVFDPVNPDHLWLSGDVGAGIRLLDLKNKTVTYFGLPMSGWGANNNRVRKIVFTQDEYHHMVIATDHNTRDQATIWLLKRNSPTESGVEAFKTGGSFNAVGLVGSYQCNGVAIHPKTNTLFFNSFASTEVFKFPNHKTNPDLKGNPMGIYDWINNNKGFVKDRDESACEIQFGFGESSYESLILIHPEGKYMFTMCINMDFIAKSFYNETDDTFGSYIWFVGSSAHAGQGGGAGYINDIGMNAKMNEPREGVFVKNPEYVKKGKADVYDFYFTDVFNHCIRKVTPEGVVTTFAGRGRVTEGDAWGYADGLARSEAMFDRPSAIAYSEERQTFYIGDVINKRIREIYFD